jgi:hypothetical protein
MERKLIRTEPVSDVSFSVRARKGRNFVSMSLNNYWANRYWSSGAALGERAGRFGK